MSQKVPFITILLVFSFASLVAQRQVSGLVLDNTTGEPLPGASVYFSGNTQMGTITNENGEFQLQLPDTNAKKLTISFTGYRTTEISISAGRDSYTIRLHEDLSQLQEVMVVSGTLKEVTKLDSPVPIEVYTPTFFLKNPAPNLFESLSNINGVRPQLNCNICNTGDIHINGLEGPYTMVLIDGMPIVSSLSTVYGLTGIPASLIDRVEVVKGPASTLYGSEAVAGLINVITKRPAYAPIVSIDQMATSWAEFNTDVAVKFNVGQKVQSLLGINYFNYQNPIDNNGDGFTDVTLQNRISVFNKLSFDRKDDKIFTVAVRYNYEDRWGGEMNWTPAFRGGDSLYGESIYTKRWEIMSSYQLPIEEKIIFSFSANSHDQNSYYGTTPYFGNQKIAFGQLTWNKEAGKNDFLLGAALRYNWYDDNTVATENGTSITWLPGIFVQDEIAINDRNKVLLGMRYDYNSIHGNIFSPRLNYKWSSYSKNDILRVSIGNGYRVANVFTEDHAALTGAREVEFEEELKPETSWNTNINYGKKVVMQNGYIQIDATAFFTHFNNKIIPDYTTDPNKIIYRNLDGYAISQGLTLNLDFNFTNGLKILAGGTLMDVYTMEKNDFGQAEKKQQLLTENYTAVWTISYPFTPKFSIDYTGNLYGPMDLPLLGDLDPRAPESPIWSIQNIQLTYKFNDRLSVYGGVKNLLNYTPPANSIARPHDPFDNDVDYETNGSVKPDPIKNPYALTFDPTYVFAPNQGIRMFAGLRFELY